MIIEEVKKKNIDKNYAVSILLSIQARPWVVENGGNVVHRRNVTLVVPEAYLVVLWLSTDYRRTDGALEAVPYYKIYFAIQCDQYCRQTTHRHNYVPDIGDYFFHDPLAAHENTSLPSYHDPFDKQQLAS